MSQAKKEINSAISKKYNISPYGNVGHEVQENGKGIFASNSSNNSYINWLLAVDFAKNYFKKLTKNKNDMATKKKSATSSKTKKLNGSTTKGLTKFTAKNAHVEGIKRDGTLKKGYKYLKGGKIVKIKPVAKKPAVKKAASKKRGLGVTRGFCIRTNPDRSTTIYGESMTSGNPCPSGGVRVEKLPIKSITGMTGTKSKTRKKPVTAKQKTAQNKFAINSRKARQLVSQGKAKNIKAAWAIIKKS